MSDFLTNFRNSATAMRPVVSAFPGVFAGFGYSSGKYEAGRNKVDITGRPFVANVLDLIACHRRFSDSEKQFLYTNAGFIRDGFVLPADLPEPERDDHKWTPTWILCLGDLETREQFALALSSITGKEDALAALQGAFADHNKDQEGPGFCELPVVTLASEAYTTSQGKKNFRPLLDIDRWVTLPPWFRAPRLPADALKQPVSTDEFGDKDIPF
jgi:hypothetical protein